MADLASHIRTDYKAVDKRDEVHAVMGWLTGNTPKVPIVLDGDRPFGIVNDRAMMGRSLSGRAHIEQYTLPTRALAPGATAEQARDRMAEFRASYLPMADEKGTLAGYVRAVDLALEFANGQRAIDLVVPVTALRAGQTMGEALNIFAKEYVDFLPVLRADGRIEMVLPRRAVIAMAMNAGDKGRKDAGGEKYSMLNDPVEGFAENAPAILAADTGFAAVLETLDDAGYALVNRPDGSFAGIITCETLARSLR